MIAVACPTSRGQGRYARRDARSELRERVLTLRTEVDLLQLEFDADRADLLDSLKEMRQAEQTGNDDRHDANDVNATQSDGRMRGPEEDVRDVRGRHEKASCESVKGDLSKDIDRRKKEFAKKARFLNEKKLELEETEAKYRTASKVLVVDELFRHD